MPCMLLCTNIKFQNLKQKQKQKLYKSKYCWQVYLLLLLKCAHNKCDLNQSENNKENKKKNIS